MLWLLLACAPSPRPIDLPATHDVGPPAEAEVRVDGRGMTVTPVNPDGPRVYYDAVHGARHLHDRDNRRYRLDYHTVGGWFRFLQGLRTAGYEVHAEDHACFDRATLDAYDVFIVGEQTYHGRFMTDAEQQALVDWVRDGGGLWLTVEHTNAHYMGDVFHQLAERGLPVRARYDSLCDTETSHPSARDWVRLHPAGDHPVTEGVDDYWLYNGCSLDTPHGVLVSSETGWSDRYAPRDKPVHNGDKVRQPDELTGSLAGVAAFALGEGRVVVVGDHNGLSNTELYVADHHRFAMNAVRWLAGAEDRPELIDWQYPGGFDVALLAPPHADFALHKKGDDLSFRMLLGTWGKEPQLRTWARTELPELSEGHEALFLGAPRRAYTDEQLARIQAFLQAGRAVVWLPTLRSLGSPAARQLQEVFALEVSVDREQTLPLRLPLEVHGPRDWTAGILRLFAPEGFPVVRVAGTEPLVQLRHGAWHIEQVHSTRPVLVDLVSHKAVGPGTFFVFGPADLFDDAALPDDRGEKQDVVRQQAAELALRVLKRAVGDPTVYTDG